MSTVKDIIGSIKHRLPDRVNVYPDLNRAVLMISKRLFYHRASMIQGSLSVSIAAGANSGTMPDDYWALMGKPYINGYQRYLEPIPDQRVKLTYTDDSIPLYYDMKGSTIHLYPGSTSAITINGDYWQKPTQLTQPSDTIPFNGLFDDAIAESFIHIHSTGTASGDPNAVAMLQNMINSAVDMIAPHLDKSAPKRTDDNIGFDCMINGDW